jgi:hypothetical protein
MIAGENARSSTRVTANRVLQVLDTVSLDGGRQ